MRGTIASRSVTRSSAAGPPRRSATLLVVSALAVAAALPFLPALVGDRCILAFDTRLPEFAPFASAAPADVQLRQGNLTTSDINGWIYPESALIAGEVRAGRLPLWNPYPLLGQPLLANLALAPFYPPSALAYVIDPLRALAWLVVLHLALAGGFAALFLRRIGCGAPAAFAGGIATTFAAFLTVRFHLPMTVFTAAWFFGLLLAVEALLARPGPRAAAGLALALGMALLAGFPQLAVLAALGAAAYGAVRLAERGRAQRGRSAAFALLGVLLGGALSAVQMLPVQELYRDSLRKSMVDPAAQAGRGLRPAALIGAVLPDFFGNPVDRADLPPVQEDFLPRRAWLERDVQENAVENALWPGAAVLAFALAGLFAARRPGPARALAALLAVGLVLAVRNPLAEALITALPVLTSGSPKRALLLVVLPLAALFALACDRAAAGAPELARRGALAALSIAVAAVAAGGLVVLYFRSTAPAEAWSFHGYLLRTAWPRVAVAIAVAAAAFAAARWRRLLPALPLLLAALAAADLVPYAVRFNPLQETAGQYPRTSMIARLAESGERSVRFGDERVAPALLGSLLGYRCLDGAEPMVLRRTGELLEALEPGRFDPRDPRICAAFDDPAALGHPLFLRTATPLVVTNRPIEGVPGLEFAFASEAEQMGVYRQVRALPRARLAYGCEVVAGAGDRLRRLADPALDPLRTVLLEEEPAPQVARGPMDPGQGTAAIVRETPLEVEVAVAGLDRPALLVLADSYAPGWTAEIDGAAATVLAADHAFRAVALGPGDHRVVFRYRPRSFLAGAALSAAALAAAGMLLLRRGAPPVTDPPPTA